MSCLMDTLWTTKLDGEGDLLDYKQQIADNLAKATITSNCHW